MLCGCGTPKNELERRVESPLRMHLCVTHIQGGVNMNRLLIVVFLACPIIGLAADCKSVPPEYTPVSETFEATCKAGQTIVRLEKGKSPVVKLNFTANQQITVSTHSGARSSGRNGRNAQVCIWQSWENAKPCGASTLTSKFNDWDGKATCSIVVPAGVQYLRALQTNESADEINTNITITCR
jgi:hypothetical protein